MTPTNLESFFGSTLSAGAILSGFCGSFLTFRIGREAAYHRQPVVDPGEGGGNDAVVGLTHFSSPFLLLLFATIWSATFGIVFPMLALSGSAWFASRPRFVLGGLVGALLLIGAYFLDELIHYRILRILPSDAREWKREGWVVGIGFLSAVVSVWWFAKH